MRPRTADRRRRRGATILAGLIAGGLVAMAATAERIQVTGQFPARYHEPSLLRRLVVMQFEGSGGPAVTAAIMAELSSSNKMGEAHFTIVSGPTTRSGRRVAADGVLAGSVSIEVRELPFQDRKNACRSYSGYKCVDFGPVLISCTIRAVTVTVNARISRTSDNRIVYSASKPLRQELSWCQGQAPPGTADDSARQLIMLIAGEIKRDISPYSETYAVRLRESTDGMPKSVKKRFNASIKSSVKNLTESCAVWRQVDAEAPNHPSVLFDLGVCAEASGQFSEAASFYQRAQTLIPGNKEVAQANDRVRLLLVAREQTMQEAARIQQAEAARQREAAAAERSRQERAETAARAQRNAQAAERNRAAARAASVKAAREEERRRVAGRYGAGAADAILARRVVKGMTPAQVQAAIGAPSRRERISAGEEQWFYPGRRIIFTGGRVSYIGSN